MPYIDGETLSSKLDRETQLGVEEAVRIASDVASDITVIANVDVLLRRLTAPRP